MSNQHTKINFEEYRRQLLECIANNSFTLCSNIILVTTMKSKVTYLCKCRKEFTKTLQDLLGWTGCRECNCIALKSIPTDLTVIPKDDPEENWKPVVGGFVSSKARAINVFGKLLTLDEKGRWHLAGKLQYAAIHIANAFKIEGYEKLNGSKCNFVVRYKDKNRNNFHLSNLYIGTRNDIGEENGSKSHQSDRFNEMISKSIDIHLKKFNYKIIEELPDHLIFEDGNIFNNKDGQGGKRFCTFSLSKDDSGYKKYYYLCTKDKSFPVHRLICIAFLLKEDLKNYEDYEHFEVNHKDGNTLNNHKDNLEWQTKSENMNHAYETKLNNKVQPVIQYLKNHDNTRGEKLSRFNSIAEASRKTDVPEHEIREVAKNKSFGLRNFLWEFEDKQKAEEYSKKFNSKYNSLEVQESSVESKDVKNKKTTILKIKKSNKNETIKTYDTIQEAADDSKLSYKQVYNSLHGKNIRSEFIFIYQE